jgi:TonB family protein
MGARVRIVSAVPEVPSPARPLPDVQAPAPEPRLEPEPAAEPVTEPRAQPPKPDPLAIGPRRRPPEPVPVPEPVPEPAPEPIPEPEPEPDRPDEAQAVEPGRVVETRSAAVRFEGQEVPHDAYLGSVVRQVSGKWLKPRTGLPPRPARIYFVIGRDGRLSGVTMEQSSGVASFDRAAMRAVRLADPLPLLPPAYPHQGLKVHFDFIP